MDSRSPPLGETWFGSSWFDIAHSSRWQFRGLARGGRWLLPGVAVDRMEFERPIDPLPQIVVADRDSPAKSFPMPPLRPPLSQTASEATTHVATAGHQLDFSWPINRFKAPDDRQQFSPRIGRGRFDIAGDNRFLRSDMQQQETPKPVSRRMGMRFGKKKVLGLGGLHRSIPGTQVRGGSIGMREVGANTFLGPLPGRPWPSSWATAACFTKGAAATRRLSFSSMLNAIVKEPLVSPVSRPFSPKFAYFPLSYHTIVT